MNRIHVIGRKNSGKTTLIVDLVAEFTRLGYRVGTIKHTHHDHELDTPGKDSHRHRTAGSVVVGVLTQHMNAIFWPKLIPQALDEGSETKYQTFDTMMCDCDIVLVEGDSRTSATKIEVFPKTVGPPPLAATDSTIAAVVTDDELKISAPVWKRSGVSVIAANICQFLQSESPFG